MAKNDVVRTVEWALLIAQIPGQRPSAAGILIVDPASDDLHVKLLPELSGADEDVAEFWRELSGDLIERSRAVGGHRVLDWLETTASHIVQLGSRDSMETPHVPDALNLLYRRHVAAEPKSKRSPEQASRRSATQ